MMVAYHYTGQTFSGGAARRREHFAPTWRGVLGFGNSIEPLSLDIVRDAYRRKAKILHPDHGGSTEAMAALNAAYADALAELSSPKKEPQ